MSERMPTATRRSDESAELSTERTPTERLQRTVEGLKLIDAAAEEGATLPEEKQEIARAWIVVGQEKAGLHDRALRTAHPWETKMRVVYHSSSLEEKETYLKAAAATLSPEALDFFIQRVTPYDLDLRTGTFASAALRSERDGFAGTEDALKEVEGRIDRYDGTWAAGAERARAYAHLAEITKEAGFAKQSAELIQKAEDAALRLKYSEENHHFAGEVFRHVKGYAEVAESLARLGKDPDILIQKATNELKSLPINDREEGAITVAKSLMWAGREQEALAMANQVFGRYEYLEPEYITSLAKIKMAKGEDASKLLARACEQAELDGNRSEPGRSREFATIARALAEAGLPDQAQIYASRIMEPRYRVEAMSAIGGYIIEQEGMTGDAIRSLSEDDLAAILKDNQSGIVRLVGELRPDVLENEKLIQSLPEDTVTSLRLGAAKEYLDRSQTIEGSEKDAHSAESRKLTFAAGAEVSAEASPAQKRALAQGLAFLDYESASTLLMAKLKDDRDPAGTMRYLKTLIEIENPKGRTLATRLFADTDLAPQYREYLARKLIDAGEWDPNLGPYLAKAALQGGKEEADAILTAMIARLGLNPDIVAYQALEKPGILEGATLDDRIASLEGKRLEYATLDRDQLVAKLAGNEEEAKLYYCLNGGAYRYALINNYSFEKFEYLLKQVRDHKVSNEKLVAFSETMQRGGLAPARVALLLERMKHGMPIADGDRVVGIRTDVEMGSVRERELSRLQDVWNTELRSLILAEGANANPQNIADALAIAQGGDELRPSKAGARMLEAMRIGKKQDERTIDELAMFARRELVQAARQKKDREREARLAALPTQEILPEYVSARLSVEKMQAFSEWKSHLAETLIALETAPKSTARSTRAMDLELTFLDKGRDFMRSLRFADGQTCCFNSKHYTDQVGNDRSRWVSRLNADPLSFIVDVKRKESQEITGFVFGRLGENPATGKPVVMVNGIYAQYRGGAMVDNVLAAIEERVARPIGADTIALANKYGGALSDAPTGYEDAKLDLIAMRALLDESGNEEKEVYDDIGTVANGPFAFTGYAKRLTQPS